MTKINRLKRDKNDNQADCANRINYRQNSILCIVLYSLLILMYSVVAVKYAYAQTGFTFSFDIWKFSVSTILFMVALFLSKKIKNDILYFIYMVVFVLLFMGEVVCYSFNIDSNPASLIGVFALLLFIVLLQKVKVNIRKYKPKRNPMKILLIVSLFLFIPFVIVYHNQININNLFLSDIYETRAVFRESSNRLLGYIAAPLSRILLPTLIALSIKNRKYGYLTLGILMVLFIFLCGALKSVLFGLIAILLLCNGTYPQKTRRMLVALVIVSIIGLLLYSLFGNIDIINIVRRVFFVPPRLNSMYADYFCNNPTFLSHSPLGLGLMENQYGSSLSMYFGEVVLGASGLNANVGVIIEGFVSFNYFGMILFALLAAVALHYFRWIELDEIYAGIVLVYIYYMNTSFLSTLLVTHGLLFLIVFAFFFMRRNGKRTTNSE